MSKSKSITKDEVKRRAAHRPLMFESKQVLDARIKEYFDYCDNRTRDIYNEKLGDNVTISWPAPYTVSGLAVFLGTNRQTIVNYGEREEFFDSITYARAKCEADLETRAIESRQPAGSIFVLKNNFRWVDESKQTLDASVNSTNELSPEALAVLAKASRAGETIDNGFTGSE